MLQIHQNSESEQVAGHAAIEAFGKVIGQDLVASASGVIASVTGTITSGTVGIATQGASLKPYSNIVVTAQDKPKSVSSLTFTLEQVTWVNNAFQVFLIGYVTSTPGNPAYAYFPLPEPKANSTLRVVVSAAHAYPEGADNFTLNISGY
jgi:hypothetical protein